VRLLIVEDDTHLSQQLQLAFQAAGYAVDMANNGQDALHLGSTEQYDAAILDLGLPRLDGLSVLKQWRHLQRKMPVLVLTARDGWSDKVAGIDAGADDYLGKPFHLEELQARIRALIRRASGHASALISCGDLQLDTRTGRVSMGGQLITLTSHELKLLDYLMHHMGEVISKIELTEHLYSQDFDRDSNTIEVFVARLRKKLPLVSIETIRGMGYRLRPP
jgi:two-component system OmpR family response regulator